MVGQCVGAILIQAETLLLGRRALHRGSYPDCWDIIGGHVEVGETFEQALAREVREEIGVRPVNFTKLTSVQFPDGVENVSELHIYRVDLWTGGVPTLRNDEHTELKWFTVDAACALRNLALRRYVKVFRAVDRQWRKDRVNDTMVHTSSDSSAS